MAQGLLHHTHRCFSGQEARHPGLLLWEDSKFWEYSVAAERICGWYSSGCGIIHRYDEPVFSTYLNPLSMISPSTSLVLEITLHLFTLISNSPENLLPGFHSLFPLRMCLESLGFRTDSTSYFDLSSQSSLSCQDSHIHSRVSFSIKF